MKFTNQNKQGEIETKGEADRERERDGVESSTVSKWNARSFRERDVCVGQRRRRIRGR